MTFSGGIFHCERFFVRFAELDRQIQIFHRIRRFRIRRASSPLVLSRRIPLPDILSIRREAARSSREVIRRNSRATRYGASKACTSPRSTTSSASSSLPPNLSSLHPAGFVVPGEHEAETESMNRSAQRNFIAAHA
jgi:hypothetical protein